MTNEDRIKAFLKGECSDKELEELRFWLSLPENKEKAEALFKMKWKEVSGKDLIADFDKDSVLAGIQSRVRSLDQSQTVQKSTTDRKAYEYPKRKRSRSGIGIVSILSIVLILGYFLISPMGEVLEPDVNQITRTAPRGYRNTVTLIDGSTATLNSESSITYSENFGEESRIIYLKGEAFFKVTHDETRPFVVISKGLKTTALGTSFNINTYKANNMAVSLATGKVRVELSSSDANDTSEIILTPGEQAIWAGASSGLIKREFDFREILSWKNNVIYFSNTKLESMITVLEKWYDVQITVNGNIKKLMYTGTGKFKNESLENVLSSLGYSMGFTYQINEKNITLKLTEEKND